MAAYDDDISGFERVLRYKLYRACCPASEDLLAFSQRIANPERYIALANHIRDCPACRKEISILDQLNSTPLLIREALFY